MTAALIDLAAERNRRRAEPSQHWLLWDTQRRIVGCACGFPAALEEDYGWGNSVVEHLIDVGGSL